MEDAYEIGIRLVLENGVSSGIAVLQNELTAYDRALLATTGRLRAVTEVGRGLAAKIIPGRSGPVAQSPIPEKIAEFPATETGRRQEAPAPVSPVPPMSPVITMLPQATLARAPALLPATPRGRVPGTQDEAARLPAAPEVSVRTAPQAPQRAAQQGHHSTPAVTVVAVPLSNYTHYAPVSPADPAPAVVVAGGEERKLPPVTAPSQREDRQAPISTREPLRTSDWNMAPPGEGVASTGEPVPPRPESTPVAATEPASPVTDATPPEPTQGDVYLDGGRVGRWVSDQLAREVDRPQSGVTGFDPRVGPTWPGSLHGT